MTLQHPPQPFEQAPEDSEFLNGEDGVFRTRRVKPTPRPHHRGEPFLIEMYYGVDGVDGVAHGESFSLERFRKT